MLDRMIRRLDSHSRAFTRVAKPLAAMAMISALAAPVLFTACLNNMAPNATDAGATRNELSSALSVSLTSQAEDAMLSGAVKAVNRAGYTGSGFADYINASGDFIRWSVTVAEAGKYSLKFRFANGGTASRPLSVQVNGAVVNGSLAFAPTGSWTTWTTVSLDANLTKGSNTVQATATGQSGGNIDWLQVSGPAVAGGGGTARKANLTWFTSYPDPGSDECINYNGCQWAGMFAALDGKQPESWVKANNIAAVHERDFAKYRLKTLRLTQGTHQIDVKVYDMCADSDCNGCCTKNAAATGFLIDIEKYTKERFGTSSGTVDWVCLDCAN
ncbi:MAG: putative exported protein [Fibrobacteres bacterium]|nr:putative exported protein [Fibrobacterota bacterium]